MRNAMGWLAVALILYAAPGQSETVTMLPGSVTVQMTPQEFRGHRVARGTAMTGQEVRAGQGVRVVQAGVGHRSTVQTGPGNSAVVIQTGVSHTATVTQTGTGQGALVIQTGTGAVTDVVQAVDGEKVVIVQHSWEVRR